MNKRLIYSVLSVLVGVAGFAQTDEPSVMSDLIFDLEEDTTAVTSLQDIIDVQNNVVSRNDYNTHLGEVWQRAGYFNLMYHKESSFEITVPPSLSGENDLKGLVFNADWGVSIQAGKNHKLHKKPIAKMISFNLDYTPFDLSVNHYSAFPNASYNSADTYIAGSSRYYKRAWKLSKLEADYSMALGPSITFAPFVPIKKNGLDYFKFNFYYHVGYCASILYIINDSGKDISTGGDKTISDDFKADFGHGLYTSYGANISWKSIGIGYEHRSGKLNYMSLSKQVYGDADYSAAINTNMIYINFRLK